MECRSTSQLPKRPISIKRLKYLQLDWIGQKAQVELCNSIPNQVTFAEGEVRVQRVLRHAKIDISQHIMTSHDEEAKRLQKALPVTAVPDGFEKWQLPFVFDKGQFFLSVGKPNAHAGEHAHMEGNGIRFIMTGSIIYEGKELKAGDWMYIPQGVRYSFKVGPKGATMGYCYQCCCGGRADIRQWLPDPAPFAG